MNRMAAFVGGALVGIAIGILLGAYPIIAYTVQTNTLMFMIADTIVGVIGGLAIGWKLGGGKARGVKLQGRFWRFPQGNLMVQISLKRMGSLVGGARGES